MHNVRNQKQLKLKDVIAKAVEDAPEVAAHCASRSFGASRFASYYASNAQNGRRLVEDKNGRWVHMIKAMRLRNETEHRLKSPSQTCKRCLTCARRSVCLTHRASFSFLKGADLPSFA